MRRAGARQRMQEKPTETAGLAGSGALVYSEPLKGQDGPDKYNS